MRAKISKIIRNFVSNQNVPLKQFKSTCRIARKEYNKLDKKAKFKSRTDMQVDYEKFPNK